MQIRYPAREARWGIGRGLRAGSRVHRIGRGHVRVEVVDDDLTRSLADDTLCAGIVRNHAFSEVGDADLAGRWNGRTRPLQRRIDR